MRRLIHNDIAIGFPEAWTDASTVILLGPREGNFSPNVTITREELDTPVSPAEYAAAQLPALQRELGPLGYEVREEGHVTIGSLSCYQRVHAFLHPEINADLTQWQVYLMNGKAAITVTISDKTETFDKNLPVFRDVLNHLEIVREQT